MYEYRRGLLTPYAYTEFRIGGSRHCMWFWGCWQELRHALRRCGARSLVTEVDPPYASRAGMKDSQLPVAVLSEILIQVPLSEA